MATTEASRGNDSETSSEVSRSTSKNASTANTDQISLQIMTHKLNGKYYLQWSRSVQMVIHGKGKYGYLDGSIAKPTPADPFFQPWEVQNSMVMA